MRRALAIAITLASAAALAGGATAAAQASQSAVSQSAASPSASRAGVVRPGFSGAEHFRIISVAATAARQSVLATGAFTAGGYQVPGKVIGLRATDKMVFPNGTFLVTRRITRQVLPLPTSSCQISETIHGTFAIGSGTGSYRGMTGTGAFLLKISGVIRKSRGTCGGPMTVFQSINYEGGKVRG
jgi:outer membrane receptor protein involved in Fe transport